MGVGVSGCYNCFVCFVFVRSFIVGLGFLVCSFGRLSVTGLVDQSDGCPVGYLNTQSLPICYNYGIIVAEFSCFLSFMAEFS